MVNVFVEFVHQLFVLFVDFVGDSEFILHGLKRILGHVANRLDGGLSSLVQSSIGVSFQVNYLQSEASKRVSSSTYIVDYMVCSSQKLAWSQVELALDIRSGFTGFFGELAKANA